MIEKCILEQDPQIEIEPEDFSEEADSTILVRERVRGTKLECTFKKVKGKLRWNQATQSLCYQR